MRYPFPGKAHVDCWTDPAVFGHFIETVVREPMPKGKDKPATDFTTPPGDIKWKKWLSYALPYVGVAALLFVAAFVLYKAVIAALVPNAAASYSSAVILQSVAGTAVLLLGVTVATRIPRLTRNWRWHAFGVAIGVLSAVVYLWIIGSGTPVQAGMALPTGGMTHVFIALGLAFWSAA